MTAELSMRFYKVDKAIETFISAVVSKLHDIIMTVKKWNEKRKEKKNIAWGYGMKTELKINRF